MLKKLRGKFIALNMAIATLVLAVAFGTICYLTYAQDKAEVEGAMRATLDRVVTAPILTYDDVNFFGAGDAHSENAAPPASPLSPGGSEGSVLTPDEDGLHPPQIGGEVARERLMPIATYVVDAQGIIVSLSEFSTAFIPDAHLDSAIAGALSAQDGFGSIDDLGLLYGKVVEGNIAYLAFVDESEAQGWQALAARLLAVGAITLAAFFVISLFFSRWALKPVEEAWGQQRQFVADASHELKTPLTVILANAAILQAHPEQSVGSQSQWVESTQTEAKRMQELVNDMLDLARLDEGKHVQANFTRVDVSDLAESETLQFESVAFERGVSVEASIEPGVWVAGDATRLQRLVRTLVDNACKYAEEGGNVHVTLTREAQTARLAVTNSGAVIDAADLPHVFDRFYRADKSRSRETGGFGLGLAIAREIAREHGGDITVASSPAEGTTFTVTLPLA